mmetsp:Transcript_5733/g.13921  ORF Transcript_5733/g.13921 Transcript_5733/m.13921 type:complete len:89 (-) Transcript_5733:641-907(-)
MNPHPMFGNDRDDQVQRSSTLGVYEILQLLRRFRGFGPDGTAQKAKIPLMEHKRVKPSSNFSPIIAGRNPDPLAAQLSLYFKPKVIRP